MSFGTCVSRVKQLHGARRSAATIAFGLTLALAPVAVQAQAATRALPLSARTKGSATAPVTVYEMSDFQCPYCRRFAAEVWPTLEKEYVATGKVRWIYIMFPLPSIHANAVAAATFAACAAMQGKFWPAHDMLFATQDAWEKLKDPAPFFQSKASSLGLKSEVMNGCLQSGAGTAMVKDDAAGAERAGAHSTPTFYIEGMLVEGAQPVEVFRPFLDSLVKAKSRTKG